jgi:dimethylaniline monooxygenase (N-oxide forming)
VNGFETRSKVAIVGSGPGGLVAAKYLKQHGLEPVVFEQNDDIGGQWNARSPASGIWPGMVTNTSRLLTCFSDLVHEPYIPIFPDNQQILTYLHRYAQTFDLFHHIRFGTRVELIQRAPNGGWEIQSKGKEEQGETFSHVIVATGRFNRPAIPPLPGKFCGPGGVLHSFQYKDPERFRGKRVLVIGCAISALEIASDLVMTGAARVVSAFRRQRYITQKVAAGVPLDTITFNRFGAVKAEVTPADALAKATEDYILRVFGSPEQWGAFKPSGDFLTVGRGLSQHFLPLVAEGRITVKPWIKLIEGQTVRFEDGSCEEFDAIILGTGYHLHLPFLSREIRDALDLDDHDADLYKFTFHPALAGLAFLGFWEQIGPYFPPLELQARWITYVWTGIRPYPTGDQMNAGIAGCRSQRSGSHLQSMHRMALLFAREAGVEPDLSDCPELLWELLFGPLSSVSFRLSGPDKLPNAASRIAAEARSVKSVSGFSAEQLLQLRALASELRDPKFAKLIEQIGLDRRDNEQIQ